MGAIASFIKRNSHVLPLGLAPQGWSSLPDCHRRSPAWCPRSGVAWTAVCWWCLACHCHCCCSAPRRPPCRWWLALWASGRFACCAPLQRRPALCSCSSLPSRREKEKNSIKYSLIFWFSDFVLYEYIPLAISCWAPSEWQSSLPLFSRNFEQAEIEQPPPIARSESSSPSAYLRAYPLPLK